MLDMGFKDEIYEVMHNLPRKHQTLLFSATMPVDLKELAQKFLSSPVQVRVGKTSSPTANVTQVIVNSTESEKIDRLLSMFVGEASQAKKSDCALTIVFVERKRRCDEVANALRERGLHAVPFHGGRSQSEREATLRDFRKGITNILVATDVASLGLDVTGVAHVINLDLPMDMEDYVHRIGRSIGRATSFCTDCDMFLVAQINKAIADVQSRNAIAIATGEVLQGKNKVQTVKLSLRQTKSRMK